MASTAPNTATGKEQIEKLGESASEAVERATQTASQLAERMGAKSEELLAMRDEYVETAREYVKENPLVAVGLAVAAGFLLGKITGRR